MASFLSMVFCAYVVFAGAIGPCSAIECFTCAPCSYPYDSSSGTTTSCPAGNICTAQMISAPGAGELYSRGCADPDQCSPGCITSPEHGSVCSYCCDQDRCNSASVADAVEDILHCYLCAYSSDPSTANFSSEACNEPFDPRGAGVAQFPCVGGECGVLTTSFMGQSTVNRLCITNASFPEGCTPGCDAQNITCQTCCSENLCNGGGADPGAPSTTAAPSTAAAGQASLAAVLMMASASLLHVFRRA